MTNQEHPSFAVLERLLTDEEINKITKFYTSGWVIPSMVADLLKAQDAKTYPIAFEAGEKAQAEKDKQEIAELETANQRQSDSLEMRVDTEKDHEQALADAKKQGKIKLLRWLNSFCADKKHNYTSFVLHKDCLTCWQSKLKELGL